VHDTGDETIAGLKTFSTGIVLGRVNSGSEGGQVDLCRSSDNASAWAMDVYGSTSTPSLRFVDNTASATRLAIDGSGNVGIGTSSPASPLDLKGKQLYRSGSDARTASIYNNGDGTLRLGSEGANGITEILFNKYGGTEAMRIDSSGNLLVGTTTAGTNNTNGVGILSTGLVNIGHPSGTGSGAFYCGFSYNGSTIGAITQNGTTAVSYNTTSDYRLKENVAPIAGALAKVAALKPCTYTWKSAPDEIGEGFIAHELAEVCPQAVTGDKDAVDEEGNAKYQSIDTSFLVATLTAAIQEQQVIITQLQADVAALKGN
jgi:hypothetical protein